MKLPNWQHHSKKEQKRSLKPQAMRQAKARRQALKKKLVAASAMVIGFASPAMAHTSHHHHHHGHYKPRPYITTEYNYRTCTKTVTTHFFFAGEWSERTDYQRIKGCRKHYHHHYHSTRRSEPPVLPAIPQRDRDRRDREPIRQPERAQNTDDNSCIEGSILGGIAGGGLGAALSRGDGRWWAIPTGIVGGALVGCQVDGG